MVFNNYIAEEKTYLDGLVKFIEGGKLCAKTYVSQIQDRSLEKTIREQIDDLFNTIKTEADIKTVMSVIHNQIKEDESYISYWVSFNRLVQADNKDERYKNFVVLFSKIAETYPDASDLLEVLDSTMERFALAAEASMSLCAALNYIENYKIDRIDIEAIRERKVTRMANWDETIDCLHSLRKSIIELLVTNTGCSNADKEILLSSILSNNKNQFKDIIGKYGEEVDILAAGSEYYQLYTNDFDYEAFKKCFPENDIDEMIDIAKAVCINANIKTSSLDELFSSIRNINDTTDFVNACEKYIKLYHDLVNYYLIKRDALTSKERMIIDEQIHQEAYKDLLEDFEPTDFCQVDSTENGNTRFDEMSIFDSEIEFDINECFNGLDPAIVQGGDAKFKKLINYIAESGYIENTDEAKQLLTYRLTARCKPNGKLKKLLWNGRGNKSANELIYIIRFVTDNSKTKYAKMEAFFEGPNFPKKNKSGCGDQARIEFREFLKTLYPTVFNIKDISQY